jgi:hypothetical protein
MKIMPEEHIKNLEIICITRYFESFAIDLWFEAEKLEEIEITSEDIRKIGQEISTDIIDYIKKTIAGQESKDKPVSIPEINIDYGLYSISMRSVYIKKAFIEIKLEDVNEIGERINNDFNYNADKIVKEINEKKEIDTEKLEKIDKILIGKNEKS